MRSKLRGGSREETRADSTAIRLSRFQHRFQFIFAKQIHWTPLAQQSMAQEKKPNHAPLVQNVGRAQFGKHLVQAAQGTFPEKLPHRKMQHFAVSRCDQPAPSMQIDERALVFAEQVGRVFERFAPTLLSHHFSSHEFASDNGVLKFTFGFSGPCRASFSHVKTVPLSRKIVNLPNPQNSSPVREMRNSRRARSSARRNRGGFAANLVAPPRLEGCLPSFRRAIVAAPVSKRCCPPPPASSGNDVRRRAEAAHFFLPRRASK